MTSIIGTKFVNQDQKNPTSSPEREKLLQKMNSTNENFLRRILEGGTLKNLFETFCLKESVHQATEKITFLSQLHGFISFSFCSSFQSSNY